MAGRKDLIDEIKVKVNQFGLEAQPPAVLAMLNGIKNFSEDNLIDSFVRKEELFCSLYHYIIRAARCQAILTQKGAK